MDGIRNNGFAESPPPSTPDQSPVETLAGAIGGMSVSVHREDEPLCPTFRAGSVQLYHLDLADRRTEQTTPATNINIQSLLVLSPGPRYDLNESPSGTVCWKLNKTSKINGVNYDNNSWPDSLPPELVEEMYKANMAKVLFTEPDNSNSTANQQGVALPALESTEKLNATEQPIPSLDIRLPESDSALVWRDYFYTHPGQVLEDTLAQAFGSDGAQYLRSRLNQFDQSDKRVQLWQKVCKLFEKLETCSFPYNPKQTSPIEGHGYNIILDMLLMPCRVSGYKIRNEMISFLNGEGVEGALAYKERRVYRGGCTPEKEEVKPGTVQFFLTTTQVRQLFERLRSFVTSYEGGQ
ncbi:hypothetical protein [Endozoicomonas sp. 8E]|uniref:hypothetical protein n=1 Tax=Endozoicomonas sp. 8E TaxID=3035692 RepID=UPI00293912A9|nr:hypothetical protein [Endozoicomonas sp. 8E]WOG28094.1 hypothetical protein P6910_00100 [Endozoicomonas sp. 8E]